MPRYFLCDVFVIFLPPLGCKLHENEGPLESERRLVMQEGTALVEGGKSRGQEQEWDVQGHLGPSQGGGRGDGEKATRMVTGLGGWA